MKKPPGWRVVGERAGPGECPYKMPEEARFVGNVKLVYALQPKPQATALNYARLPRTPMHSGYRTLAYIVS